MSYVDQEKAIASIGNVSTMLRRAIGAALPVAPEQYLTIAIPGTVIDLTPIEDGGTYVYDVSKYVQAPTQVRQAEAKLVDGMMPLSNIMVSDAIPRVPFCEDDPSSLTIVRRLGTQERVCRAVMPVLWIVSWPAKRPSTQETRSEVLVTLSMMQP